MNNSVDNLRARGDAHLYRITPELALTPDRRYTDGVMIFPKLSIHPVMYLLPAPSHTDDEDHDFPCVCVFRRLLTEDSSRAK